MIDVFQNRDVIPVLPGEGPTREPLAFHRRLPGYAPTPLVDLPGIARRLGVGRVWLKDESARLGLPAFKILGASWAVYRRLAELLGREPAWGTLEELRAELAPLGRLTLAAATDGNHGRAVARMAALLDYRAHILVPAGIAQARIDAIADEGATVTVVEGSYDHAVEQAAGLADERTLVISDTSWPGYEQVPRWVIDGYSTILWEVDDELARRGEPGPDLVVVQIGVGAFAAAVTRHYRRAGVQPPARLVGVEPTSAACLLASMRAGRITLVPGPHTSIMAGLNAGLPSLIAWPIVSAGIDLFAAIDDDQAREAMHLLAAEGVAAGETGVAGLGGLLALFAGDAAGQARSALGVTPTTCVLLFSTEGVTDAVAYERIVGAHARDVLRPSASRHG
jgi:diaminopropionate ammonia-lyase